MYRKFLIPIKVKTILKMIDGYFISKFNRIAHPDFRCNTTTKRCFNDLKSPNYKYEYYGKDTPPCCAANLYAILKDVTAVLEQNNIEHFISYGTLLGAVRHGGLIPWDTDVDILIPEHQKQDIILTLKKALSDTTYQIHEDRDNTIVGSLIRVDLSMSNTLHVDLFTYIEEGNSIIFGENSRFNKTDIFPLQKINYYDTLFYAPKEIKKHLTQLYGGDYDQYAYRQWALNKKKFKLNSFKPAKID